MANTKKKTVKADKEKSTLQEPVVTEVEAVEKEPGTVQEEIKEEEVSDSQETEAVVTDDAQAREEDDAAQEPGRKKRKYTKRAAKENKTEKAAPKKSKKEVKETGIIQEVYIEFNDNKILSEEVIEQIRQAYKNEGHRISSIKKLQVYMNLDEKKAYYVINDKAEGKFVEF